MENSLALPPGEEAAAAPATLGQAEERYHSLFRTMGRGLCILEKVTPTPGQPTDYRYVAVNPAFTRHSGQPDVTGQTVRQAVPGIEPRIMAVFEEVLASGTPGYFEEYVADLKVWIAGEVLPDPQPGHLAVLFRNVSARHRAEEVLRESAARQAYLLALSDTLRSVTAAGAVQAAVTQMAMQYFQANRCYYGELDGDRVTIRQDAARPGPARPAVGGGGVLAERPTPLQRGAATGRCRGGG